MKCPHCAAENKDAAKFCGKCGQTLVASPVQNENSKSCPGCGQACKSDAKFCPKCGQSFSLAVPAEEVATTKIETPVSATTPDVTPCPHCGADLKPGAKFCGKCGKSTTVVKQEEPLPEPSAEKIEVLPIEATELSKPVMETGVKPVQTLPEAKIVADKPAVPVAESNVPPPLAKNPTNVKTANETLKPSRKIPLAPIAAGIAALVIALSAGGYFLMKGRSSPDVNEATQAKTATQPVVVSPAEPPPLAAAQKPEELPPPNLNQGAPKPLPMPAQTTTTTEKPTAPPLVATPIKKPSASKAKQTEKETVPAQGNPLQAAIDAGMDEGEKCMAKKKFDCAISSASTILRLDPHNSRALEMKRKAKEAQDRALSQINIQ